MSEGRPWCLADGAALGGPVLRVRPGLEWPVPPPLFAAGGGTRASAVVRPAGDPAVRGLRRGWPDRWR